MPSLTSTSPFEAATMRRSFVGSSVTWSVTVPATLSSSTMFSWLARASDMSTERTSPSTTCISMGAASTPPVKKRPSNTVPNITLPILFVQLTVIGCLLSSSLLRILC